MHSMTGFDPLSLAKKLRNAAAELRWSERENFVAEQFARRLEAHADAMLRPEAALQGRFFTLRETRLTARGRARPPRAAPGRT